METRPVDRLAQCILAAASLIILFLVCRSISSVLAYILAAAVVSLVGRPISNLLGRISIFRKHLPGWLTAALTLILELGVLTGVVLLVTPVFSRIASDISKANLTNGPISLTQPFEAVNVFLRSTFTALGPEFKIEGILLEQFRSLFDISKFTNVISGVASFVASFGVGIFSVVFISFFFIKDGKLFSNMVSALVPDRHEAKARESISEIESLVSRYFSGICLEVLGVTLINFLGLLLIGRMGFQYSMGIAFMAGILNVIPYVGPLIGEAVGTLLAVVAKYVCAGAVGLDVSVGAFALIILAILFATQLVDNFLFQPLIYSSSVKAHPLEIFLVLLIVGHFAGALGMFVAIPAYTVLRVIAAKFFGHVKVVRKLTGAE